MTAQEKFDIWKHNGSLDTETKNRLERMTAEEIKESFTGDLEFGTGGLRGIMDAGTNRMNIYTVRKATQGLAAELGELGEDAKNRGVVIAYDSRNHSHEFALEAAKVLCANGIKTYLFDSLRPTPELSFAVRHLGCARGIVITASHNPKEYNGYKVYGEDGGQIPPDTAERIIRYINGIDIFEDVRVCDKPEFIPIGKELDDAYQNAVYGESMHTGIPDDFKIVYTPLHGAGNLPVRGILDKIGAKNVFVVPEQEKPDGDFPTVHSPNPENAEAFTLAIEYAKNEKADLIFGTDPDSDRIGVVVKAANGEYKVLNGNQTGILLCEFLLRKLQESGKTDPRHTVVKTIVTTDLVTKIASAYQVDTVDVLTGFKYIGEKIKEYEQSGEKTFLFGLEESYGYLKGTYARDKDAVVAAMLIAEMAADYKKKNMTLYDGLQAIYQKYGFSSTKLVTQTYTGLEGAEKIRHIMELLRNGEAPFEYAEKRDYLKGDTGLPRSNVLKYILADGWIAVRPSGTEPKIKFYFEVYGADEEQVTRKLDSLVSAVTGLF